MKHIKLFEQFVNEKVYRLTGMYGAKGLVGKVMQAFKKKIEKIKYDGDISETLKEVNETWDIFVQQDLTKIILDQVKKGDKTLNSVTYVTANFSGEWRADDINGLNKNIDRTGELFICYSKYGEFVINVGFKDSVNGRKLSKKIDKTGIMNSPIASSADTIFGAYDPSVGDNNLEIRDSDYMSIDPK